ncbi:MAG: hypothetical protein Q8M92_08195, partial [Candidatus Subteraquimicrobiales bacterium]|nr:hypothetical protein [Candidatus Subteraquimicrobiales bacterium]
CFEYIQATQDYLDILKTSSPVENEAASKIAGILKEHFLKAILSSDPYAYLKNQGIEDAIKEWLATRKEPNLPIAETVYKRIEDVLYAWIHLQKVAVFEPVLAAPGAPAATTVTQQPPAQAKEFKHPVTSRIAKTMTENIDTLADEIGVEYDHPTKKLIRNAFEHWLSVIDQRLIKGEINPYLDPSIKTCKELGNEYKPEGIAVEQLKKDNVKLAIICSAANPPHVVHLLMGLKIMAEHGVDRILFAPTGVDERKPVLGETKKYRYPMTKKNIKTFEPLMSFTDVGDLTDEAIELTTMKSGEERKLIDGEDYSFRLFEMNKDKKLTLCYMVGTDHYYRIIPPGMKGAGNNDSINKLLENVEQRRYGFDLVKHKLRGIFVERGTVPADPTYSEEEKQLMKEEGPIQIVRIKNPLTIDISSTKIRAAAKGENPENWILTTLECLKYIQATQDYLDIL